MYQNIFQFPEGTEVEFTLSRNKVIARTVLRGKIIRYSKGIQTVIRKAEHKAPWERVKSYPVNTVQIETASGRLVVDVDCIITRPTQEMVDEVNRRVEVAIDAKKQPDKKSGKSFKLGDVAKKTLVWTYVASKHSKLFHDANSINAKRISDKNLVRFRNRSEAVASGRAHASK